MWYEDVHFLQLRGTVILMLQILIAICPVEKLACFSLLSNLQGAADRVLIYLTLYISECLKKLQKVCVVQRAHRVAKAARCILGCTDVVLDLFMVGYLLPPLLPPPTHTHTHVQCPTKNDAQKSLATLAVSSFDIPGDPGFPLNAFMAKPGNRAEAGKSVLQSQYMEPVYSVGKSPAYNSLSNSLVPWVATSRI